MRQIKEWVVVEGKHDTAKLKQYYQINTVETHGTYLSTSIINQLKLLQQQYGLIVFTDPDSSGNSIRERISKAIPEAKHAYLQSAQCRDGRKVGIEHASATALHQALDNLISYQEQLQIWDMSDLVTLGLTLHPQALSRRDYLTARLQLGDCNAKSLVKRLNARGITHQQVIELLEVHDE